MMMKKYRNPLILFFSLSLVLSACGPWRISGPTITSTPTVTLVPTFTRTPTPTLTFIPSLTLTLTPTLPARAITTDWTITGNQTVENEAITLDGNLVVKSGGSLTLKNMRLRIRVLEDGKNRIQVEPGATLSISGCDIASTDKDKDFLFVVDRGKFSLKDSVLSGIGTGGFSATRYLGLALIGVEGADIEGNTFYHPRSTGLALESSNHAIIKNNKFINVATSASIGGEFGIDLASSSDNLISANTLMNQREAIFVQQESWNNTIEYNTILGAIWAISIRHGAGNTLVQNNQIGGPGYIQWQGLYLDTTPYPTVFMNNVINTSYIGATLSYTANAVIANNTFHNFEPTGFGTNFKLGAIHIIHSRNNQVLNNQIDGAADGGITLLFSTENAIKGNSVSASKYGIGLFYDSDQNQIENNALQDNSANIILQKTSGNTLTLNNIQGGKRTDYDSGNNAWDQNYWSIYPGSDRGDGIGDVPYVISPGGEDPSPRTSPATLQTFPLPNVDWNKKIPLVYGPGYRTITGVEVWKNQTIQFIWGHLTIASGGSLVLDHATLVGASGWADEPEIDVQSGGSLEIESSEIAGGRFAGSISINVEQGGKIVLRNSTLHDFNGLTLGGDDAVIENNLFSECFFAVEFFGSGRQILNNTVRYCQFGIVSLSQNDIKNILQENTVTDIVADFNPLSP